MENLSQWAVYIGYIITQATPMICTLAVVILADIRIANLEKAFRKVGENIINILEVVLQQENQKKK